MVTLPCPRRMVPPASLLLSLLLACTPFPKNVGDDELGADDDGSGESLDPDEPLWSHVLPAETVLARIVGMPDGSVAAIELRYEPYEQRVTRYAADGTVLWQTDVGSHWLRSIAALPDGRLLVGGTTPQGGLRATLWRLSSTGVIEATHVHPLPGDAESNASVAEIAVGSGGIAYLVDNSGVEPGTPGVELWWSDIDLVPQWSWASFDGYTADVVVMGSGEIRTIEQLSYEQGTDLIRAFAPDGTPTWDALAPLSTRFADDEPLVLFENADGFTWLHGVDGTSPLDVMIPQPISDGGFTVTHGHGVAAVRTTDLGMQLELFQFDEAGALVRQLTRPTLEKDRTAPLDIAIAPDGAVYIAGYEDADSGVEDVPGTNHGFILKLPPPA